MAIDANLASKFGQITAPPAAADTTAPPADTTAPPAAADTSAAPPADTSAAAQLGDDAPKPGTKAALQAELDAANARIAELSAAPVPVAAGTVDVAGLAIAVSELGDAEREYAAALDAVRKIAGAS